MGYPDATRVNSLLSQLCLRRAVGRIAFARIEPTTLVGSALPLDALRASLRPGTRIERHNRVWRMGPWTFEGLMELWDDVAQDFIEEARPMGLTSPFAIDPDSLRVAFQVRGRDIRVKSFTGALQNLLNEASPTDRWRVRPELVKATLEAWAGTVDRITAIRATLERPNPHYAERDMVRALVERTGARIAEAAVRADRGDPGGLAIGAPFIQQAIEHAAEDYGAITAVGTRGGEEQHWSSTQQGAAEVRRVGVDPETKDVSSLSLRRELGDPSAVEDEMAEATAAIDALAASLEEPEEFDVLGDDEDERGAAA